jgi:hypothetical protein
VDGTFLPIGDLSIHSGIPFSIGVPEGFFYDPDGGVLAYALAQANGDPLPAWLAFDASTRTLSGTPPIGADDVALRLTATDVLGASTSIDFTLSVTDVHTASPANESFLAGSGADLFVFSNGFGQDRITGFTGGEDVVDLSGMTNPDWTSFADVQAHALQLGGDTLIDFGGGNTITLVGVTAANLTAGDFQL